MWCGQRGFHGIASDRSGSSARKLILRAVCLRVHSGKCPEEFAVVAELPGAFFCQGPFEGRPGGVRMTGSAPPSGGSRGRPFLRPMRERSALHHDAPSRSGVPAALPQSQGLRPLSLVHLLLLADAKNPRRRLARTAPFLCGRGAHNVEACAQED